MDAYLDQNRRHWDALVPIHATSRFYDVDAFVAGRCALLPLERDELGDVSGRSLVHLQCHFGLDTLSWARRGARVTGVDFSPAAVQTARALAARCRIDARFVEAEVTTAADTLGSFDVVFTSWGVIGWLPDLPAWGRTVAALLRPGGTFYMAEIHPTALLFSGDLPLRRRYPYFPTETPLFEQDDGTYADRSAHVAEPDRFEWIFTLADVVMALIDAGLRIEWIREHDVTCCDLPGGLVEGPDRMWRMPPGELSLPLSFSIRATRP